MCDAELPLFTWRPPVKVLLFPLIKRVGKIRRTASLLGQKHGEDASLYWKQVMAANRKHLARVGLDGHAIELELQAFQEAVQREMVRQACSGLGVITREVRHE